MDKSLCMYTEVFALIKRMRSGLVGTLKPILSHLVEQQTIDSYIYENRPFM